MNLFPIPITWKKGVLTMTMQPLSLRCIFWR